MIKLRQWLSNWTSATTGVTLLMAAATAAVVITVAAGTLVYGNTRKLISSGEWVQHTQDVLATLQRISLLFERIEYRTHLYLVTGNEEQLVRARASVNQLETTTVRLRTLVEDNPSQTTNVQGLIACSSELNRLMIGLNPKSEIPEVLLQRCQQTLGLMTDNEQWLLKDRSKGSQRNSVLSIGTELGFVLLSLALLLVLFGLLLRDALMRQRIGRQTMLTNERLAGSVKALEDRARESELLTSARDELQLCVEVQQVYQSAADSFSRLLAGTGGALAVINNSRQLVEVVSSWDAEGSGAGDASPMEDFFLPDSCCGLRSGQPRWRHPGVSEIHCAHFSGGKPERYLCKPIVAHGNTLGVLYVQCATDEIVTRVNQHMDGLRQLVQLTGMAIATLNLRTKLENQSIRDSLTGLFNRHFMQISLERELSRAARRKQILAVFMLDLDHFKKFNDSLGHSAGDMALMAIADIFRASVRTEDIACRYGGEEFTIILPDVTPAVAADRAESIRRAVENMRLPLEGEVLSGFTVSIGLALYPSDGEAADLLLRRADSALYRAKRLGRNQVALYETALLADSSSVV
jgi:diguanylate cyclase (GGDEF)-like protein